MYSYDKQYGLLNMGQTCYANSLLQALFSCEEFNQDVLEFNYNKKNTLFGAYKTLVVNMFKYKDSNKITKIKPTHFLNILFGEYDYLRHGQQDSSELMYLLFDNFCRTTSVNFTNNHFLSLIKNFRYNDKIKNICARDLIMAYKQEYSIVNKYFDIHLLSSIRCSHCDDIVSKKIEIINNFNLPIDNDDIYNIKDAFNNFLSGETLTDYRCNLCDKKNTTTKTYDILNISKYMFVTLKRFRYKGNSMIKCHKKINYDLNLDMTDFLIKDNKNIHCKKNNNYKLQNILQHRGNYSSGHYYCIKTNETPYKIINDEAVFDCPDNINNQESYILLFKLE